MGVPIKDQANQGKLQDTCKQALGADTCSPEYLLKQEPCSCYDIKRAESNIPNHSWVSVSCFFSVASGRRPPLLHQEHPQWGSVQSWPVHLTLNVNLEALITSMILNAAQLMSYPNICNCGEDRQQFAPTSPTPCPGLQENKCHPPLNMQASRGTHAWGSSLLMSVSSHVEPWGQASDRHPEGEHLC